MGVTHDDLVIGSDEFVFRNNTETYVQRKYVNYSLSRTIHGVDRASFFSRGQIWL